MKQESGIYKTDTYSIMGLLVNTVGTTAALFIPLSAVKIAQQDGWMTMLIAMLGAVYLVYVVYRLGTLYSDKIFIEYLPLIIGKAGGKILGLAYILFFFYLTSSVIREAVALFFGTGVFKITPEFVIPLFLIIATTYAVVLGFEVICRVLSIYWLVISTTLIVFYLLVFPYMDFAALLPVGEASILTLLKSAMIPQAYMGELFILAMLSPYIRTARTVLIAGNISTVIIICHMTVITISMVTILGVDTPARSLYAPFFLADIIQPIGIKALLVSIWMLALWGKIVVFQFIVTDGISKYFNLKQYQSIIIPVAILLLVFSFTFYQNNTDVLESIPRTFPGVALFFEYLIPTLLLIIALIRSKIGASSSQ